MKFQGVEGLSRASRGRSRASVASARMSSVMCRHITREVGGVVVDVREAPRVLARAANLDPAVVESGLHLGASWGTMKEVLGRTTEEVRAELETARQWDEVESVLVAITETVRSTNLKRKHGIGALILQVYGVVGARLRGRAAEGYAHLRPFYEEMKRAILGSRKKKLSQRG